MSNTKDYEITKDFIIKDLYLEVPQSWENLTKQCIAEILDCVISKGMHPKEITFMQIKEKYNQLRIYYDLPILQMKISRNFMSPEPTLLHIEVTNRIDKIIEKYDEIIRETIVKPSRA